MSYHKLVTIVIVNWNSGALLRASVDSILTFGGEVVHEIVVVDNGSVDGSCEGLADQKVRVILTGKNLGFGKACNLGAQHANSKYILFFNPDAQLLPGGINEALQFMEEPSNTGVGICGVQLIDESGHVAKSCSRFPSVLRTFFQMTGLCRLSPDLFKAAHMAEWSHGNDRVVDQVIGAFFLIRSSLFSNLGGFDERFFVYYEEVDLSLRAKLAGFESYYLASVRAFHAGGGTSYQVKARRLFYSLRSRILYAQKHFGPLRFLAISFLSLVVEPFTRLVFGAFVCSKSAATETIGAYRMLYGWVVTDLLFGSSSPGEGSRRLVD